MIELGDLEFKPEDFISKVNENTLNGLVFAKDLAALTNRVLREKLEKAKTIEVLGVGGDSLVNHRFRMVCPEAVEKSDPWKGASI